MDTQEIEKKLWTKLLNRLELEKRAANSSKMTFMLDEGRLEGVEEAQFEIKAIERLLEDGLIQSLRARYPLTPHDNLARVFVGTPSPQPIGYEIEFVTGTRVFDSMMKLLRVSLENGDVNAKPVFEFQLNGRDIVIWDYEKHHPWLVRTLSFDTLGERLFSLMFKESIFDVTEEYLMSHDIEIKKGLNDFLGSIGFKGDLKSAFFETNKSRLVLHRVLTKRGLDKLGLTSEALRKHLKAIEELR